MANLAEGFKRIPGFEEHYSINKDGKIQSYHKLGGKGKGWILSDDPVSFVKWQQGDGNHAKNFFNVQLHKDGKRKKINVNTMVCKLFGKKPFLYKRRKRAKPVDDGRIVIEAK